MQSPKTKVQRSAVSHNAVSEAADTERQQGSFLMAAAALLNGQQQAWADARTPIQPRANSLGHGSGDTFDAAQPSGDVADAVQHLTMTGNDAHAMKADAARQETHMQLQQDAERRLSRLSTRCTAAGCKA